MSPRRYHWGTRQKVREKTGKRWTRWYTAQERVDLASYATIPSPRGSQYLNYIQHRMRMLPNGIAAYATKQYAKLNLDKYIQSNRESDEIAVEITQNQPSLIYMGGAELHPNRPIGIKKQKRCPGVRKLVVSIKKLGHSMVIFVNEYFTSQTCANCFARFDRSTRRDRFKVCRNCNPTDPYAARLPSKVITQHSKRHMQGARKNLKSMLENNFDQVRFEGGELLEGATNVVKRFRQVFRRLVPKVSVYYKNWHPIVVNHGLNGNAANVEPVQQQQQPQQGRTVVWHRDIVAARCIMHKGI